MVCDFCLHSHFEREIICFLFFIFLSLGTHPMLPTCPPCSPSMQNHILKSQAYSDIENILNFMNIPVESLLHFLRLYPLLILTAFYKAVSPGRISKLDFSSVRGSISALGYK